MSSILLVDRFILLPTRTLSAWYLNGVLKCFGVEDRYRGDDMRLKVKGETCIPCGTWPVIINRSPRFQRDLPRLLNVTGFEGVLIHPGNKESDTEGCLLPNKFIGLEGGQQSVLAFDPLFAEIKAILHRGDTLNVVTRLSTGFVDKRV